jgi:hypothetical protein
VFDSDWFSFDVEKGYPGLETIIRRFQSRFDWQIFSNIHQDEVKDASLRACAYPCFEKIALIYGGWGPYSISAWHGFDSTPLKSNLGFRSQAFLKSGEDLFLEQSKKTYGPYHKVEIGIFIVQLI